MRLLNTTRWPEFLVTHGGRAGVIEVDGPHHYGGAAADHARDQMMRDAGVVLIERIAVEDIADPSDLHQFVERFIQRLLV